MLIVISMIFIAIEASEITKTPSVDAVDDSLGQCFHKVQVVTLPENFLFVKEQSQTKSSRSSCLLKLDDSTEVYRFFVKSREFWIRKTFESIFNICTRVRKVSECPLGPLTRDIRT